jgi:hypothetical protein
MQGWGQRWSLSNNRQAWPPEVAFESELEQTKKTTNLATGPSPDNRGGLNGATQL